MSDDLLERGVKILDRLVKEADPFVAVQEAKAWAEEAGMTTLGPLSEREHEYALAHARARNTAFPDPIGSTVLVLGDELDEVLYTHAARVHRLKFAPPRSKTGRNPIVDGQSLKFAQGLWQRREVDSKSEAARRAVEKYGRGDRASDKAAVDAIRHQLD